MDPETEFSLGLSLGPKVGAAVLIGPKGLVAAAIESRTGSRPRLPTRAIQHCLKQAGLKAMSEIGVMALQTRHAREPKSWLENLVSGAWGPQSTLRDRIQRDLKGLGDPEQFPEMILVSDENALARGIFVSRAGEPCAILNLDMPFVKQATSLWRGGAAGLENEWTLTYPQSLELLCANLSGFSGFRGRLGQRQFLQLAEYGEPRFVEKIKEYLFQFTERAQFNVGMDYISTDPATEVQWSALSDMFTSEPRQSQQPIGSREIDLAHSLIEVVNEWALKIVKHAQVELIVPKLVAHGQGPLYDRLKNIWKGQSFPVQTLTLQNDSLLMATGAAVEALIKQEVEQPPVSILRLTELAANVSTPPLAAEV